MQCIIELTGRNSYELAQARKKKNRVAATPDALAKAPAVVDAKFEEIPKSDEGKEVAEVKKAKAPKVPKVPKAPKPSKTTDSAEKPAKEPAAAKETKKETVLNFTIKT